MARSGLRIAGLIPIGLIAVFVVTAVPGALAFSPHSDDGQPPSSSPASQPLIPTELLDHWKQSATQPAETTTKPSALAKPADEPTSRPAQSVTTRPDKSPPAVKPAERRASEFQSKTAPPAAISEAEPPLLTSTQPTTTKPESDTPQVEVYIPSVAKLAAAAQRSKTAGIYRALSGMIPSQIDETDEGLDVGAILKLVERIAAWPDTSIAFTTYTADRDGRPRWAVKVDWPLKELRGRVKELLAHEAARQVLKDVRLRKNDDGSYRLELPDQVLAVLSESGEGSLVVSAAGLEPPEAVFGQQAAGEESAGKGDSKKKPTMLLYCRLNLEAEEEGSSSPFAMIADVKDISFGMSLGKDGSWNEKYIVRWNPLIGAGAKLVFQKTEKPFPVPRDAYAAAVFNIGLGDGIADTITGLKPGAIGGRASSEAALAVVPGTGFLPFPDIFFQFNARAKDKIIDSIRKAIDEDAKKRKEDERRRAWRETEVGGRVVFWRDPTADGGAALMPVTYRTVLFFDEPKDEDDKRPLRLIISQTSSQPEDAVRHWEGLTRGKQSMITVPTTKKIHWQALVNWKGIYALAQPYLSLLTAGSADTTLPPMPDEMAESLTRSTINLRIEYGGLQVRHNGPIPSGLIFVPSVAAMSLRAPEYSASEAARERLACRNLRVLHHHAQLFQKDYGRWPATIAELDGYVDFSSHPNLLFLPRRDRSFVEQLAATFGSGRKEPKGDEEEREIDDSLYEIEWSPDEWKLKFRADEFNDYLTIYIDQDGEICRVPKPGEAKEDKRAKASTERAKAGKAVR